MTQYILPITYRFSVSDRHTALAGGGRRDNQQPGVFASCRYCPLDCVLSEDDVEGELDVLPPGSLDVDEEPAGSFCALLF